jgi:hypothetical protein
MTHHKTFFFALFDLVFVQEYHLLAEDQGRGGEEKHPYKSTSKNNLNTFGPSAWYLLYKQYTST